MKFLLPVILVIIAGGLFLLWIDPTYKDIQVVLNENQGYVDAIEKVEEVRKKRAEIQEIRETISEEQITRLKKILPERINNIDLILDINNIADINGMNISDIRINDLSRDQNGERGEININDEGYETVSFSFSVVSTYDNFKEFLSDLSLSLRVVDVTTVTITPINNNSISEQGASSVIDLYRFDVGIDTYWQEAETVNNQ